MSPVISLIGILVGLVVLILLAYKGHSIKDSIRPPMSVAGASWTAPNLYPRKAGMQTNLKAGHHPSGVSAISPDKRQPAE